MESFFARITVVVVSTKAYLTLGNEARRIATQVIAGKSKSFCAFKTNGLFAVDPKLDTRKFKGTGHAPLLVNVESIIIFAFAGFEFAARWRAKLTIYWT